MTECDHSFTPRPHFPQNPEFYRRVLHQLPTPVLVVTAQGEIIHGNRALELISGWDRASAVGTTSWSALVRTAPPTMLASASSPIERCKN